MSKIKKIPKLLPCRKLKKKTDNIEDEYLLGIKAYLMIHRKNPGLRLNTYHLYRRDIEAIVKNDICLNFARSNATETMESLSNRFGLNLAFWYRPDSCTNGINEFVIPELMFSVTDASNKFGTVNFLLDRKQVDIEKRTFDFVNCSLILDEEICGSTDQFLNIFEAISLVKNIQSDDLMRDWGKSCIKFNEEKHFHRKFQTGFEVWTKSIRSNIDEKNPKRTRLKTIDKCLLKSSSKNPIYLYAHGKWQKEKFIIDESDKFRIVDVSSFQHFNCPKHYCSYRTSVRQRYDDHVLACKSETNHIYHQQNLTDNGALEYLMVNKWLTKKPNNFNCAFYDIETTSLTKNEALSGQTIIKTTAKLATISVTKNFGDKSTKVFARESSSEESYVLLINEFIRYDYQINQHNLRFFSVTC